MATKKTAGNVLEVREMKKTVFDAIKSLGNAPTNEVAAKAGCSSMHVRQYGYQMAFKDEPALVSVEQFEGERQCYFSLTAAGKKAKMVVKGGAAKKTVTTKKKAAPATKKKVAAKKTVKRTKKTAKK